jgi:protein-disulfide isomerase
VIAQRDRRLLLLLLGGAALAAVVVVVLAVVLSQGDSDDGGAGGGPTASGGGAQQTQSAAVDELFGGIPQRGVTLGQPDAPATLIEFADLQCPFCAEFTVGALPTVIQDYVRSGRLKMQLRLLRFIGPDSERGSEVAAAAALQNKGWEYSDLFYRNQGQENSGYATDAFLEQLARETPGLDVQQLEADLDSPAAQRLIRQAERQANVLGVSGTPTFFVQQGSGAPQQLQLGSLDAETVTSALDAALGEQ